jgi:hypothetical protein
MHRLEVDGVEQLHRILWYHQVGMMHETCIYSHESIVAKEGNLEVKENRNFDP